MHALRWIAFVLIAFVDTIGFAADPPARPSIKGLVTDSAGAPVPGATVYIWTAGVKTGYSTFCPSCYADCGKHSETNDRGEFEITSLDPDLQFQLMVAKHGYPPTSKSRIDPQLATLVQITLPPLPALPKDPEQTISGIVTDLDGKPVANAMVSPEMITWQAPPGESNGAGGAVDGLDKFTITDQQGRFTLAYSVRPVKQWQLRVDARGFAGAMFKGEYSEKASRGLKIGPGAIVRGRLLLNGTPVTDAELELSHAANMGGFYLGRQRIGTDKEGHFLFANVPIADFPKDQQTEFAEQMHPLDGWWIAPTLDSLRARGAIAPKLVHVSQHSQIIDVGDIELGPSLHIKGRVVCEDGNPVPEGSHISIENPTAWETSLQPIAQDGTFTLDGLHSGDWIIHTSIPGYNISPTNPSKHYDGLQGRLDSSLDNFLVVVDSKTKREYAASMPPYEPFKSVDPNKLPTQSP